MPLGSACIKSPVHFGVRALSQTLLTTARAERPLCVGVGVGEGGSTYGTTDRIDSIARHCRYVSIIFEISIRRFRSTGLCDCLLEFYYLATSIVISEWALNANL